MDFPSECDLRRRSALLRSHADLRLLNIADGPASGARIVQARIPRGLAAEFALDRGADLFSLSFRGVEIGWHSAVDGITPWPDLEAEEGLGFLRGFDGFLVTCGLDHHGVAGTTPADDCCYPLRKRNHQSLHGRISATRAEMTEKVIDWDGSEIRLRLILRQATVFGEVLELQRLWRISLDQPVIRLEDRVINRSFRPTRHGILYHLNLGAPFLGAELRLEASGWPLAAALDEDPPIPTDDHVEIVTTAASPSDGRVALQNRDLGLRLNLLYEPSTLPVLAMWRAYQSGVFALGIEPQTTFADANAATLASGERRDYGLAISMQESILEE